MGLSYLMDKASELIAGESQPPAATPAATLDPQAQYGNAAVLGFLGLGEDEDDKKWMREMFEETRDAINEQIAAEKLKEKLHVGEDAVEGKANVSQEEFDRMVKLHSDIRAGKTHFKFDTGNLEADDAVAFKNRTMDDMAKMMQTPSGRALLSELARDEDGHPVILNHASDANAPTTSPLYKGRTYDYLDAQEREEQAAALERDDPTGSYIAYRPGHTVETEHDGSVPSDVVLFHELVHAHHFAKGTTAKGHEVVNGKKIENAELQTTEGWHGDERYTENGYRWERRRQLGEDIARRETYGGRDVDEGPQDRAPFKPCLAW